MNQRSDPPTGDSPTEKLLDGLHNLISAAANAPPRYSTTESARSPIG